MATPKKVVVLAQGFGVEEENGAAAVGGELVRAASLNDKRENVYSATVGCDGFVLYIFEHKRAVVKDFVTRLQELGERGAALQARSMPVAPKPLIEGASSAEVEAHKVATEFYETAVQAEVETQTALAEALQSDFNAISLEVCSCIRAWDLPDESGAAARRRVDYAAELEAENIGPTMAALIFERVLAKHTLQTDERKR